MNLSKFINFHFENPLRTWMQARKYFKLPKLRIRFYNNNKPWRGSLLSIESYDVGWKTKWGSSRFEESPNINICLFNKFRIEISWHMYYIDELGDKVECDDVYWEYLIDSLDYNFRTLLHYSAWRTDSRLYRYASGKNEEGKTTYSPYPYVVPCVTISLNKKGLKKLKEELNERT
jgi:hypothetical protein